MVETISYFSRVSDRTVPAYQNLDDRRDLVAVVLDGPSTLAVEPSSSSNSASQNPATVISFSQAALDRLTAMQSSAAGIPSARLDRYMSSEDANQREAQLSDSMSTRMQIDQANIELSSLNRMEERRGINAAALQRMQSHYAKMRDTPPKAAVTLNAADTAKALKMLKDAGRILTIPGGKDGSYGFVQDGIQYNFKGDGTVTTQQEGVATSSEDQKRNLETIENSINQISSWLADTSDRREALATQRDALLGKLTSFAET